MKHARDTQWVTSPTRERLATVRKRTLRRRSAMTARSVWSECQSRVIEPRKLALSSGPSRCGEGGQYRHAHSKTCLRGNAGQVHGGRAGVYERGKGISGYPVKLGEPLWSLRESRNRTPPGDQRPCREPGARPLTERTVAQRREPGSEGNRSDREAATGSLSGPIVALESRETRTGRSL